MGNTRSSDNIFLNPRGPTTFQSRCNKNIFLKFCLEEKQNNRGTKPEEVGSGGRSKSGKNKPTSWSLRLKLHLQSGCHWITLWRGLHGLKAATIKCQWTCSKIACCSVKLKKNSLLTVPGWQRIKANLPLEGIFLRVWLTYSPNWGLCISWTHELCSHKVIIGKVLLTSLQSLSELGPISSTCPPSPRLPSREQSHSRKCRHWPGWL